MTELIRAASLSGFSQLARSFGLQPGRLLSAAGIDHRALDDPEMRISTFAVGRLLELAASESNVDTFGLRMAENRRLSILGPIGLLLREEPTVRAAIGSLAKYMALHNEAVVIRLQETEGRAIVTMEFHLTRQAPFRQGMELSMVVLFRVIRPMAGDDWRPLVCFTHSPPANLDVHHRMFGPRINFLSNYNGLIFPAGDLDRLVAGADPAFADQARRHLDMLLDRAGNSFQAKVRNLVQAQLSSGRCTTERIAHQIGCDRRTLHRRLAIEQTTFDAVLESVRSELAVRLMQNRNNGLDLVAELLGFSSASAFSRWFVGAFGKRPSEWRKDPESAGRTRLQMPGGG